MTHFDDIGFNFQKPEELAEFLNGQLPSAKIHLPLIKVSENPYLIYEIKLGQIRFFVTTGAGSEGKPELVCANPGFLGSIWRKFRIEKIYKKEDCNYCIIFSGALEAQNPQSKESFSPQDQDMAEKTLATEAHFQVLNYLTRENELKPGDIIDVNLVIFPHSLNVSKKEETEMHGVFIQTKQIKELPRGTTKDIPDDVYGLAGEIKDWKELENPVSKCKFLYLVLYQEILGDFEVVAPMPPQEVFQEKIQRGNIVFCEGWLSGVIR
ncbi:MAG: hypothetical protein Q8P39_02395 [Candidatus Yanofskybacteria bacterium]|nr:hypothetical protein [Candidatus Yanofskybacteria bacterium]